ncbi:MAG TPA: phosphatidylserine decarboxylase [Verrucomicrobiota bacterium]|nr:phosphatidylserine decarboxylase [Verrucomicrobiota bacterium]
MLGAVLTKWAGLFAVVAAGAGAWLVFAAFTFLFFRDPTPRVPSDPDAVVAPAHGRVDFIGPWAEPEFMGGDCQRISIFLSVFDVHVQTAPMTGLIQFLRYQTGRFHGAFSLARTQQNENLFIGLQSTEHQDERIGVRLIAGFIARRVLGWVKEGEFVEHGERLGMIQFGSRCDLYLPPHFQVVVQTGDRVKGGETIVARRDRAAAESIKT